MALISLNAACRYKQRLRGSTHLTRVQRQRKRQITQHALVAVGGLNHDVIHASQLGIHTRLAAVIHQPLPKHIAAREINRLHCWVRDQMLRSFAFVGHAQRDEIRVDAVLGQHRTYCAHSDRHRQYRYLVRFDNDCVASRKRGEQTGEGIPSGEGAATHDHRHTTADDLEMFFHDQRRVLALGFFPHRFAWHKTLLAPGMRHGF